MKKSKTNDLSLGDRMKTYYESVTSYKLPRRTYTIIRLDGKAFHTYAKNLNKPFDNGLIEDMDKTAKYLFKNIQGCKIAYVQSDEISLVLTDFDNLNTDSWFGSKVQKISSVSASMATAVFNKYRFERAQTENKPEPNLAFFDSRVFTIPFRTEVINYLIWRQQDWKRNSIRLVGQKYFSHKELHSKNNGDVLNLLLKKYNVSWERDYSNRQRFGRTYKKLYEVLDSSVTQEVNWKFHKDFDIIDEYLSQFEK